MKTSELTGAALDWAVAKCEGVEIIVAQENWHWYSSDWAQGGPIIEREMIELLVRGTDFWSMWEAKSPDWYAPAIGSTPLIAAMRCYVASKMGDEIEIPTELTRGESK